MALTNTPLPYGLRDVKVFALTGEVAGDGIDLPNSRTFSFSEAEDFEELRGDDAVVAVRGKGAQVNWELESGGVPLEALKVINGGTITEFGVTPNQRKRYRKKTTDARPYFKVEGKAISDSGGDFHVILYRCRSTGEVSGEMSDGAFWLTGASGAAIGRETDALLYDFIQNESEVDIDVTPAVNEVQTVALTGAPTGGTFTLSYDSEDSDPISVTAAPAVVEQAVEQITGVGVGNVSVTGTAGGPWAVTFVNDLGDTDVVLMEADDTGLTGGTDPGVTVTETVKGG